MRDLAPCPRGGAGAVPPGPLWSARVFSLFPGLFPGPLGESVVGRALESGIWSLEAVDLRDYALDRHRSVDDTACGGGPGMVMRADVVDRALRAFYGQRPKVLIYLSPRGIPLNQTRVRQIADTSHVGIVCGRFEGLDQRLIDEWAMEEVCVGDFVVSGGEVPAMMLMDACVRLLPGVLGCPQSVEEESFSAPLLEYPQYTKPRLWHGRAVPEVLLSGNHALVKEWRRAESEKLTRERRPDLWAKYQAEKEERKD